LSFVKIDAWVFKLDEFIFIIIFITTLTTFITTLTTFCTLFIIIFLFSFILDRSGVSESRGVNSNELVIWDGGNAGYETEEGCDSEFHISIDRKSK
jgi:hypothetical protein